MPVRTSVDSDPGLRRHKCQGNPASDGSRNHLELPIPAPHRHDWMRPRRRSRHPVLVAVRNPPMVLFPRHFRGVADQILARNVMVLAELGAAQAREE